MTPDRRLTASNGRVAHLSLKGRVTAEAFVEGRIEQVIGYPFLHAAPGGAADRQLLWGDRVRVLETRGDWSFVQSVKDGYVGYLDRALTAPQDCTHSVTARTTWAYPTPDFKQPPAHVLHLGSRVQVSETGPRWARIDVAEAETAFVPAGHLSPLDSPASDPVAVAERFLGTPYVWAGNCGFGIDCSGLVQIACHACGIDAPGDSDLQEAALGATLPPGTPPLRGDLLFWKGHVAWVADPDTILHANAGHMAVTFEPLQAAIARIAAQGDGPVTRHARL